MQILPPFEKYPWRGFYLCVQSFSFPPFFFFFFEHHKHLTTFVLDRKDAMITVEDGIRKLKLLDAKGKVWTQDMILQVDDRAVSLIDLESKASRGGLCHFSLKSSPPIPTCAVRTESWDTSDGLTLSNIYSFYTE